ncbi:MAG TPA: tRNA pseudouridine(55) synthase TruB [Candidatus Binatia bacterium]
MLQSGIILIDKPEGPSSSQLVQKVKRMIGARKVGHLGTLDPFASGLLLLGVNEGTKVADIFLGAPKSYSAVMVLGVTTDSQDRTGQVIETRPVPDISDADVAGLEKKFTGDLQQIPPMFSALKRNGVRLYQLARKGKEIARESRSIRIETLRLERSSASEIRFEVTCSRGTYVRTLAADMGNELGCGAHLKELRRIACGHLSVSDAFTVEQIETLQARNHTFMLPLNRALAHVPAVSWPNSWVSRLRLGQQEILAQLGLPATNDKLLRIEDGRGELVALLKRNDSPAAGGWCVARVFRAQ